MSDRGTAPAGEDVRGLLARLVAFDTVSSRSNRELIDWVAAYLARHGVESRLTPDSSGTKANLFATIGPKNLGGVILSGHTDVVPVAGQNWTSDPFTLVERDGRLYGRGSADMKGFIALMLALVPRALAGTLAVPLHLALSFDEEIGCNGAPLLIGDLPEGASRPRLAIIGEPTLMQVVNAHKACHVRRTRVTGVPAHSSQTDRGVNAIAAAAEIVAEIGRQEDAARARAKPEMGFDPPYTTFNLGTIEGGTAFNIVARECTLLWDIRTVPGEDPAELAGRIEEFIARDLLPRLRARHPDAAIETEALIAIPPLVPEPGSPAEALARRLSGANRTSTAPFASEAGIYQGAGIPAVLCGPGSIDDAHRADEFIALSQLAAGEAFFDRLLDWARTGD